MCEDRIYEEILGIFILLVYQNEHLLLATNHFDLFDFFILFNLDLYKKGISAQFGFYTKRHKCIFSSSQDPPIQMIFMCKAFQLNFYLILLA